MKIKDIINVLDYAAPPSLQESYDNAGLLIGNADSDCSGILCSLDVTEEVLEEAIAHQCNLIVAHHPPIFKGLKRITGNDYTGRIVIKAIKHDIAIYAIHTNLDNIITGVSNKMADLLELTNREILFPKGGMLKKLYSFVPLDYAEKVRLALFNAGAGYIGNYSQCSFNGEGTGTYKAEEGTKPFAGSVGSLHYEKEVKIEVIFPAWLEQNLIQELKKAHPYEEVAYDLIALDNPNPNTGSGLFGLLKSPMGEKEFFHHLKEIFNTGVIRHTALRNRPIQRVALCGGAGSFLIINALQKNADIFITADIKYHDFFDADGKMVIADIGHYESEQFTIDLLHDILVKKFTTFAVLKTAVNTNPVFYFA